MGCMYCEKAEKLQSVSYPICSMKGCELYLNREQSYPGRLILVNKRHAEELDELTEQERRDFMDDLCAAVGAMRALYSPDKVNCGMFGDGVKHLHVHIVPKKEGGLDWNGVFQMNPRKTYLSDEEYEQIAQNYRKVLGK